MKISKLLAITSLAGALTATAAIAAQTTSSDRPVGPKRVQITYENLTSGQAFSPSVFVTHNETAPPLFKPGDPASFGLMRIAEEGNSGPFLSDEVVKHLGERYGAAVTAISILPGQSRTVQIDVDRDHPMLSGAWMLVMTNDGFTGISGVNAYELDAPKTFDLMAYDAGTERNNEQKDYLIAKMGTKRDPEGGVVSPHPGIRGDADAPASWKFEPSQPVARLTIKPLSHVAAAVR